MGKRKWKILLVEPHPAIMDMLLDALVDRLRAHITCVADGASCLDVELVDPHDLVIAECSLADVSGLTLASRLMSLSRRPVILMAGDPTCDEVIAAMRLGVRDFLRKPFPIEHLLESAQRMLVGEDLRRQRTVRYRSLRDTVRRMIRERRDLNQRMELVCRDLVDAHRRLVHRVLALEENRAAHQA